MGFGSFTSGNGNNKHRCYLSNTIIYANQVYKSLQDITGSKLCWMDYEHIIESSYSDLETPASGFGGNCSVKDEGSERRPNEASSATS